MASKHENNGSCERCEEIIDRFPGLYEPLYKWFREFQSKHPEAHISCAGRGQDAQIAAKKDGRSRASWGKSAHNYNAALDFFENQGSNNIYDRDWFDKVLRPNVPAWLQWFGAPDSKYYELPHVQVRGFTDLVSQGILKLVE